MGGGNGGGLLRSVGRVVTRANFGGADSLQLQELNTISSSSTTTNASRHVQKSSASNSSNNNLVLSSPNFASSNVNNPVSSTVYGFPTATTSAPSWPGNCDEALSDWVAVDGCGCEEVDRGQDFVLGPVPSEDEVHSAVSALQQVFNRHSYSNLVRDKFVPELAIKGEEHQVMSATDLVHQVPPVGSELDWIKPSFFMCNSEMLQRCGCERVYDAFHLLRTEPLVQEMVKSLSSDEAVWNAVLNNETVRELRDSFYAEDHRRSKTPDESSEDSDQETNIVKWIFYGTRARIMGIVEKITKLVNDFFQPPGNEKVSDSEGSDPFKEKLRTSFMLSVMVLLVVVLTRAHNG